MKSGRITRATFLTATSLLLTTPLLHAGSATWDQNPVSRNWNNSANWTPMTVPNNPADIATFGASETTDVNLLAKATVAAIVFEPGAPSYDIATKFNLNFAGDGIVNNSGVPQRFAARGNVGQIQFRNSSTAGDATLSSDGNSGSATISEVAFHDTASAANAKLVNTGGFAPGVTIFFDSSTAGDSTIYNYAAGANGALTVFTGTSSAGTATISCTGGSAGGPQIEFLSHSSAGQATMMADGGTAESFANGISFMGVSKGGSATVTVNGGDGTEAPGAAVGLYNSSRAQNITLIANSGTNAIESGAQFNAATIGRTAVAPGTVLIAVINTSTSPISGTFANLPDGGTITIGNNTFQADYEGGDGNDLTLTALP